MNGKISKLIRKVAETNPYEIEDNSKDTKYVLSPQGDCLLVAPGHRFTVKYLKKFYKSGKISAKDLKDELVRNHE